MAKCNKKKEKALRGTTHNGARVIVPGAQEKLRRSILSCMLWEDSFYEDGESVAKRIGEHITNVSPEFVSQLAKEARNGYKLRHAPLFLISQAVKHPTYRHIVADALEDIIQRPDELAEFLAMYWTVETVKKNPEFMSRYGWPNYGQKEFIKSKTIKKTPIAASVKKGLARAFTKFDEYQLSKWNRDGEITLKDVLFLCHAKPKDAEQAGLWKRLIEGTLKTADTWEVRLSGGGDKKTEFTDMLEANLDPKRKNKLGALALLRNLRNMEQAGVDRSLIKRAIKALNPERVLPFRFITSAKHAPDLESALEEAMLKCLGTQEVMPGRTVLLVDVSGSMSSKISNKSEMTRLDAACGIAMLAREVCEDVDIYTFETRCNKIAPRRGFALRDAIGHPRGGTNLRDAMNKVNSSGHYDRVIVFTDEQSSTTPPDPIGNGYIVNVANYENGVAYHTKWTHVNGFSEATVNFIREIEKLYAEAV